MYDIPQTYTFEQRRTDEDKWKRLGQEFSSSNSAAREAAQWLDICAQNGIFPQVRLVNITQG